MSELKASSKQIAAFLSLLGVKLAEVSTEDNPDFKPDELVSVVDTSRRAILEPQILEAAKEKLTSEVTGRAAGTLRALVARKTGISKAELDGLNDGEMIEKGLAHYESKMGKDTEGLREEMKKMGDTHKAALEKREAELMKEIEAANQKYITHFITEGLVDEIKELTLSEGTDRLAAAKLLHRELSEMSNVKYDETTKKISLRNKENPELPLYNDGKTAELKPVDIAKNVFGKLGMLQSDMRGKPPAGLPGSANNGFPSAGGQPKPQNAPTVIGGADLVELANAHWK